MFSIVNRNFRPKMAAIMGGLESKLPLIVIMA